MTRLYLLLFGLLLFPVTGHSVLCPYFFAHTAAQLHVIIVEKAGRADLPVIRSLFADADAEAQPSQYLVFYRFAKPIAVARVAYQGRKIVRVLSLKTVDTGGGNVESSTLIRSIQSQSAENQIEVVTHDQAELQTLGFDPSENNPTVMVFKRTLKWRIQDLFGLAMPRTSPLP